MRVPQAFEARAVPSLMWEKDREIERDIQRGREAAAPSQLPGNSPRGMDLGRGGGPFLWALSPAPLSDWPWAITVLATPPPGSHRRGRGNVLNFPSPPLPLPAVVPSLSPILLVGSGVSTSSQRLRMSKFLGCSWSLAFYHPSILVNSQKPVARNAREI